MRDMNLLLERGESVVEWNLYRETNECAVKKKKSMSINIKTSVAKKKDYMAYLTNCY
jgi:hypothetical protein